MQERTLRHVWDCVCVRACVRVCVKEREVVRERERYARTMLQFGSENVCCHEEAERESEVRKTGHSV